jgi:hypothetical protein
MPPEWAAYAIIFCLFFLASFALCTERIHRRRLESALHSERVHRQWLVRQLAFNVVAVYTPQHMRSPEGPREEG